MEDRREVCLEEEVGRLRRSGMGPREISREMGVEPVWVEEVLAMLPTEEDPDGLDPEESGG